MPSTFNTSRDKWRQRNRAAGTCIDCKEPALKPNKRCARHLAQVKAAQKKHQEKKRAAKNA